LKKQLLIFQGEEGEMPDVGSVYSIKFSVASNADEALGREVRLHVIDCANRCPAIMDLLAAVPPVTVLIKTYGGSGAVTNHRTKKITVSNALTGGKSEMAEAALFELLNWQQGDFSSREHDRVEGGEITPEQAGINIAKCESRTVHTHGQFLQALKASGATLSAQGERNRAETADNTPEETEHATLTSAHDDSAPSTDSSSLFTPQMYWYQMIENKVSEAFQEGVAIGAINRPPTWLQTCIKKVVVYCGFVEESRAAVFVRLIKLAKEYGCTIKGGYEFTAAMKTVAKETTPVSVRMNMSTKTIPGEGGMPGDLKAKMKSVGLIL
jgi:hypothetical protein